MTRPSKALRQLWKLHGQHLRIPVQIAAHWPEAGRIDPRLLEVQTESGRWAVLERLGLTLRVEDRPIRE